MTSVFSHIIQKRFSRQSEDIATDALAYILRDDDAREAMTGMLRGIVPGLPGLRFETQESTQRDEARMRPDMVGRDGDRTRVFVENKFWAGLTVNQPVSYLTELAGCPQPSLLLVIGPEKRGQTLQRALSQRLTEADMLLAQDEAPSGAPWRATTKTGPTVALTSWRAVLDLLEEGAGHNPGIRADIGQLRSLCDAADDDAFTPVSLEDISDQQMPGLILRLTSVVQATVDAAVTADVLSTKRLRPQADWWRIGQYVRLGGDDGWGTWFGIYFTRWKSDDAAPLWLDFDETRFGRGREVREVAARNGIRTFDHRRGVAIPLRVLAGAEKEDVVSDLVNQLRGIALMLAQLPPSTEQPEPPSE